MLDVKRRQLLTQHCHDFINFKIINLTYISFCICRHHRMAKIIISGGDGTEDMVFESEAAFEEAYQRRRKMLAEQVPQNSEIQERNLARKEPPYPAFEGLNAAEPVQWARAAPDALSRLFWTFNGPLKTAIGVFETDEKGNDKGICVPYSNETDGTPHPISKMAVTRPRVSSIMVRLAVLGGWEESWEELHWEHWDNDAPEEEQLKETQDGRGVKSVFPEGHLYPEWGVASYGYTKDDGDADDDLENIGVIACCGIPRPIDKDATIVVVPANKDGPDGGYVTVHDFVTTVHPWAMSLRGEVLQAMGEGDGNPDPKLADTGLMFECGQLEYLYTSEIKDRLRFLHILPETVAAFTVGIDVTYRNMRSVMENSLTPYMEYAAQLEYVRKMREEAEKREAQ